MNVFFWGGGTRCTCNPGHECCGSWQIKAQFLGLYNFGIDVKEALSVREKKKKRKKRKENIRGCELFILR